MLLPLLSSFALGWEGGGEKGRGDEGGRLRDEANGLIGWPIEKLRGCGW